MRWALLGPLYPYRGGIAHYGALLADVLAREDEEGLSTEWVDVNAVVEHEIEAVEPFLEGKPVRVERETSPS